MRLRAWRHWRANSSDRNSRNASYGFRKRTRKSEDVQQIDPYFKSARRNMIRLLAFTVSVLVLAATSHAQERPPIFQQMFKAYGFESFGQVEKIRYTFNLEFPGLNLSRSWEWEPKTDLISYEAKIKTASR